MPEAKLTSEKHLLIFTKLMILISFLVLSSNSNSSSSILHVGAKKQYELSNYAYLLEDPSGRLTIEDIVSNSHQIPFRKNNDKTVNLGITTSVLWVRLNIQFDDSRQKTKEWILEIARGNLEIAELYITEGNKIVSFEASDKTKPYSSRYLNYSYSHFPIKSYPGHEITAYLRLKHYTGLYAPLTLFDLETLSDHLFKMNFLYGLFYGSMCLMVLYNFLLLLSTRDIGYLYYTLYLASTTVWEFMLQGTHTSFFEDTPRYLEDRQGAIWVWVAWVSVFLFVIHYLDLKKHPTLYHIYINLCIFSTIGILLGYVFDIQTAVNGTVYLSFIMLIIIPATGLFCWHKGNKNAPIFCAAWAFNIGGFLTFTVLSLGIVPANTFTMSAMPIGTVAEAIVLSLALSRKIKIAQKLKIQATNKSKKAALLYHSIIENSKEGIYLMSPSGKILSANPSMAKIMGYSDTKTLINNHRKITKSLFKNSTTSTGETVNKNIICEELLLTNASGQTILIQHTARIVFEAPDRPTHIEGTISDLTERTKRESAQKARIVARLEKEFANKANRQKSNFLTQMSFEIRTKLGNIIGFGESLRHSHLESHEKSSFTEIIIKNSNALLSLINDILDYSKIEAGKMPIEHFSIELFDLIESIKPKIQAYAGEKNITFDTRFEFPLPKQIFSDSTRTKQVLESIGRYCASCDTGGNISLVVRWDSNIDSLLFSFFYSEKNLIAPKASIDFANASSLPTKNQATEDTSISLQLAIAKKLAELMKGGIDFERRADGQTTCHVRIIGDDIKQKEWLTQIPTSVKAAKTEDPKLIPKLSGNILVAEDNLVNQKLIQKVIQRTGASVTLAGDGKQAVDFAAKQAFDLILMDLNMPVMDGIEATVQLRSTGCSTPIYALTAEYGQSEIETAIASGCSGHLKKPLEIEKFYAVLQQHLQPYIS